MRPLHCILASAFLLACLDTAAQGQNVGGGYGGSYGGYGGSYGGHGTGYNGSGSISSLDPLTLDPSIPPDIKNATPEDLEDLRRQISKSKISLDLVDFSEITKQLKKRSHTEQVVNDQPAPAYQGPNQPPADPSHPPKGVNAGNCGTTITNTGANVFLAKYSASFQSIAAVIKVTTGGQATLLGTAFPLPGGVVVTAKHVVDVIKNDGSTYYLVFNVRLDKFPRGLPTGANWSTMADTVLIPTQTKYYLHPTGDGAAFRLSLPGSVKPFALATAMPADKAAVSIAGVPGRPAGIEVIDDRSVTNYQICGMPVPDEDGPRPVVLRFGYGYLDGGGTDGTVQYVVNTLGGDSGAPLFEPNTGRIVGMNIGTSENLTRHNTGIDLSVLQGIVAGLSAMALNSANHPQPTAQAGLSQAEMRTPSDIPAF